MMALRQTSFKLLAILTVTILGACATRPPESEVTRSLTPMEAAIASEERQKPLVRDNDGVRRIIAFSAGGPDGAFGAGVVRGWAESGKRPDFDVVTGVSTGALLAVLFFLGDEYEQLAEELYTTQTNDDIFRFRGLRGLFGDSLYDNRPLEEQIEKYVTQETMDKIAVEHRKGRRLYIGTVNLDAGLFVTWNMGEIANGGRTDSLQHFQKVIRASAAVPGFFQPVYIKPQRGIQLRQAHVDGGVKEPILFSSWMTRSTAPRSEVYLVVNGSLDPLSDNQPVEPNLPSIAQKTIFELMREVQNDTIYRHSISASRSRSDFYLVSIPRGAPISTRSLDFDPVRMRALFEAGRKIGLDGTGKWTREPPSPFLEDTDTEERVTMDEAEFRRLVENAGGGSSLNRRNR